MWVRGLKQKTEQTHHANVESHPMWVRGLKHQLPMNLYGRDKSHPMWVRGLKHHHVPKNYFQYVVAPYVGAWIETKIYTNEI